MFFAHFMALPLYYLNNILMIINRPLIHLSNAIHKNLGKEKSEISIDHLKHALDLTLHDGTSKREQYILKGIINFGKTEAKQIMKARIDIFAVEQSMPFSELVEAIVNKSFSRVPVYNESLDDIVGILYVKDMLQYLDEENFDWSKKIREPVFVPEYKKLNDLLRDFQKQTNHMAIVVDEYGGTSGLVTLEDIVEEIIGDINDEYDSEEFVFEKLDNNRYTFEGKTSLKDFYKIIDIQDSSKFEAQKGEHDTLAGFLLEILQTFPKKDETINFEGYTFRVKALNNKRIIKILVIKPS